MDIYIWTGRDMLKIVFLDVQSLYICKVVPQLNPLKGIHSFRSKWPYLKVVVHIRFT